MLALLVAMPAWAEGQRWSIWKAHGEGLLLTQAQTESRREDHIEIPTTGDVTITFVMGCPKGEDCRPPPADWGAFCAVVERQGRVKCFSSEVCHAAVWGEPALCAPTWK